MRTEELAAAARAGMEPIECSHALKPVIPSPHPSWGEGGGPPDEGQPQRWPCLRQATSGKARAAPHPAFGHLLPMKNWEKG